MSYVLALSSHTVTPLVNGNALIIGRLGGLKTQRKTSSVFLLKRLDYANFEYTEMPSYHVTSRSGHSSTAISSNNVAIIGGRDGSNIVEQFYINQPLVEEIQMDGRQLLFETNKNFKVEAMKWPSRKYHSTLSLAGGEILIFGGESCSGTNSSTPLNDCWIYRLKNPVWKKVINFQCSKLTGHKTVNSVTDNGTQTFVVGGFDKDWLPNKFLYKIIL